MTRNYVFGAGTLYVDGKPYAGVTDMAVEFDPAPEAQVEPFPVVPDSFSFTATIPAARAARFHAAVIRSVHMQREWENAEVLRMLGEWVSGLEPALLLDDRTGELRGLTIDGLLDGVIAPVVVPARERACRVCGCTESRACLGRRACHWVGADLCSACT